MVSYRFNPDTVERLTRRTLQRYFLMVCGVIAMLCVMGGVQGGLKQFLGMLVLWIPFAVFAYFLVRMLFQTSVRARLASTEYELDGAVLTLKVDGEKQETIRADEVSEATLSDKGVLLVGKGSRQILKIPRDLGNFEELAAVLQRWAAR